ncbi:hypothetical protein [Alkalispirochaeta americana]|nr:hypothetical protein [Alkalispirochaeta americana]
MAVSLSLLGMQSRFVPWGRLHLIGEVAVCEVQRYGVDVGRIQRGGARLGAYNLEAGANQRASNVVNDREISSISAAEKEDLNWVAIFEDVQGFHKNSQGCSLSITIDLNYRENFCKYGASAPEVMSKHVSCRLCNRK